MISTINQRLFDAIEAIEAGDCKKGKLKSTVYARYNGDFGLPRISGISRFSVTHILLSNFKGQIHERLREIKEKIPEHLEGHLLIQKIVCFMVFVRHSDKFFSDFQDDLLKNSQKNV